jgi:NAD(P)-dependent dehydrogenase (short-subunit alcohol dehydrogenase family)
MLSQRERFIPIPYLHPRPTDTLVLTNTLVQSTHPAPNWPNQPVAIGAIMSTAVTASHLQRKPELLEQSVVVIGGSAGIGLETARRASSEGAKVILTGRSPERLQQAAREVDALSTAAFDAMDPAQLAQFFRNLTAPVDHIMVTAGRPTLGRIIDLDLANSHRLLDEHVSLFIEIARNAAGKVKAGGTLIFMGGTGGRQLTIGLGILSTVTAALPALTANLALELAPVRVNLIAAGFIDTELSASILGDELEARRRELRAKLPIRRVVQPTDVAALAVHIMTNTALTGATFDIDGGQQLIA